MGNPSQPSAKRDLELITSGRTFFESLTTSFEVAGKLIALTEGFERTASAVVGQETRKRSRDYTPPPIVEETMQPSFADADTTSEWFSHEFLESTQALNDSDFQAQLMEGSDLWMAPATLDWDDWVEYIGRMPVQERI
jgi:hypothetical protein